MRLRKESRERSASLLAAAWLAGVAAAAGAGAPLRRAEAAGAAGDEACSRACGAARRAAAAAAPRCGCRSVGYALASLLDQLVERQIQHVVAALAVHEHLGRIRVDLLHGVQVHPLANHSGRFRVLRVDLLEALGIALRLRDTVLSL